MFFREENLRQPSSRPIFVGEAIPDKWISRDPSVPAKGVTASPPPLEKLDPGLCILYHSPLLKDGPG
ncbi:MAG: hypothetical protein KCHDKBKB_01095 [Elusimicrobia bacterium]|nr:hypothetical protein [Elusimicrobiota bacterium]